MNVVDSSGWLEYLANGPNATLFAPAVEKVEELVVPTISIYEVFKRVLQQRDEATALEVAALMSQGEVVDLTGPLAVDAARLSRELALSLADSIILATSKTREATLWTQDADFGSLEGVKYIPKRK